MPHGTLKKKAKAKMSPVGEDVTEVSKPITFGDTKTKNRMSRDTAAAYPRGLRKKLLDWLKK